MPGRKSFYQFLFTRSKLPVLLRLLFFYSIKTVPKVGNAILGVWILCCVSESALHAFFFQACDLGDLVTFADSVSFSASPSFLLPAASSA